MSTHFKLNAQTRTAVGHQAKKLRKQGITPAVVYSKKFANQNIQVNTIEFFKLYRDAGNTHVIDLNIDGKSQPTLVHELEIHPVTHRIVHIDFLAVDLKEDVQADVPVRIINKDKCPGVKVGGVLNIALESLEVVSKPDNIPDAILIDAINLDFDGVVYISDLKKANKDAKFKILGDDEMVVVSILSQDKEDASEVSESAQE